MQLQREADGPPEPGGQHARDVAVQFRVRRRPEEPHAGPDELPGPEVEGTAGVVPRLGHRPEQVNVHQGVAVLRRPDLVEQPDHRRELVNRRELADRDPGRQGRPQAGFIRCGEIRWSEIRWSVIRCGECPRCHPVPPGDPAGAPSSRSLIRAAMSAARPGNSATRTCSSSACAPPPAAPSPSSVGVPTPAVKFPSDAPPTAAAVRGASPSSAASRPARSNSSADAGADSGARFGPPLTWSTASGTTGSSDRIAASTRACSALSHIRTSPANEPTAGTVLDVVPDDSAVGVTEVPRSGSPNPATASTWWASSTVALTPRSGSSPACAARPTARTW